jgi:hypothetical protein
VGNLRIDRSLTSDNQILYHFYYNNNYVGNGCQNPDEKPKLNLKSYLCVSIIREILGELEKWEPQ